MTKQIFKLKGVQVISKRDQEEIYGSGVNGGCTGIQNKCCVTTSGGFSFCDEGKCINGEYCLWY
ncbi:hypothetical protein [Aquimarina rhabdastrellae]